MGQAGGCWPFFVVKTCQREHRPGKLLRCPMRFQLSPEERLPVLCADRSSSCTTMQLYIWVSTGERNFHVVSVGRFLQPKGCGQSTHRCVCKVTGWHALSVDRSMQVLSSCIIITMPNTVLTQWSPRVGLFVHSVGNLFK